MEKHELLVPAGDIDSLKQAIFNGADAVYLACKNYGARKFAKNFDNDEIIEALKLAHLYGVKIYVTMNTLVRDNEVENFLKQIEFLHTNGVDAILMQDFGMINLVRNMYPNLEIHASTQANNSSSEICEMFYKLGVKRIVFSREMSINEINKIDVPIEKEAFIHGALCISYSGCCLMSSMIGNRSANRGECAGCCRLPYTLKEDNKTIISNKYLLSTKELNTSSKIKEILDSNIYSLKIEGRMKSPEYVGFITRFYRKLIDNNGVITDFEEETNKLKTIFNREFTQGRLFNIEDKDFTNIKTPNHIGLEIGKVIEVTPKKIKIKLDKPLNQQDGIRFLNSKKGFIVNYLYDRKDNLINSATDICYVDNKVELKEKDIVCKTIDYNLMQELQKLPTRKVNISIKVTAKLNKQLKIEVSDGINSISKESVIVESSINAPITKERIISQVEKLGDTPFISINTSIDMDNNIFISIKELNNLRRSAIEDLINIRSNTKKDIIKKDVSFTKLNTNKETGISVLVTNNNQLKEVLNYNINRIYTNNIDLYNKNKTIKNLYYVLPRCTNNITSKLQENNLVSDYFSFNKYNNIIGNYPLNITNIYTAYYLYKEGLKTITLSVELTEEEIINFINNYYNKFKEYPNIEIINHSRVENMIIKGNILNLKENVNKYTLTDFKNRIFPVYYLNNQTHILNYELKQYNNLIRLKDYTTIRIEFLNEDSKEVKEILKRYI